MIAHDDNCIRQSGVIPYRVRAGRLEVALITARLDGRWVIPKGHVEPDMTPHESAAKEAFEEAGLLGRVDRKLVGRYVFEKRGKPRQVEVYGMEVREMLRSWPEMHERRRRWMTIEAALALVEHDELRRCIERFARQAGRTLHRQLAAA